MLGYARAARAYTGLPWGDRVTAGFVGATDHCIFPNNLCKAILTGPQASPAFFPRTPKDRKKVPLASKTSRAESPDLPLQRTNIKPEGASFAEKSLLVNLGQRRLVLIARFVPSDRVQG